MDPAAMEACVPWSHEVTDEDLEEGDPFAD